MDIFVAIVAIVIIVVGSEFLSRIFLPSSFSLPFPVRVSTAIIILSIIASFLGFTNLLIPEIIYITYAMLLGIVIVIGYIKTESNKYQILKFTKLFQSFQFNFVITIILVYLAMILMIALTPPLSRDALNYHLFLPKLWLSHNKIITIPENIYSFFPGYWESFLTIVMVIGNDITSKLFHFMYLIFLYLLLGYFLKEFGVQQWKEVLSLMLVATPVINKIAGWAYLDLVFTFYTLSSLYLLLRFARENNPGYFWLSAIFAGYSIGIKYLGLIWLLCLLPFFAYYSFTLKNLIVKYGKYLTVAIITGCPFYIRNWISTGNPVFPFLSSIFPSSLSSQEKYQLLTLYFHSYGKGITILDFFLLPFRLLFCAQFRNPAGFDGKLNILYAIGFLLIFKHKKHKIPKYLFLIPFFYTLFWFYLSQQMRFLIPVLFMLIVIYALYLPHSWHKVLYYLVAFCSLFYLKYPLKDLSIYKPYRFILGIEDRKQFLSRNFKIFPFLDYINKTLTPDNKIMLLDMGPIGYYLDIPVFQETIFESYTFKKKLKDLNCLQNFLHQNGITHILTDMAFVKKYLLPTLDEERINNFQKFIHTRTTLIAHYHNWYLFQINF